MINIEEYMKRLFNHTVKDGKYLRGSMVYNVAKVICSFYGKDFDENNAMFLSLSVEFVC
jgi:hypothetical protein